MKKTLESLIKLSSRVTVYVPSTVNVNVEIDNAKYVDEAAALLSRLFGGATSTPAVGYWISNTHGLIKEKTTMVFSYCTTEALNDSIDELLAFCEGLCKRLNQEAIALEINGEMAFISPTE